MAPGQFPFIGKGAERKEESSATGKKKKKNYEGHGQAVLNNYLRDRGQKLVGNKRKVKGHGADSNNSKIKKEEVWTQYQHKL